MRAGLESIQELYVICLKDLHAIERDSIQLLDRLLHAAGDVKLQRLIATHLHQTLEHGPQLADLLEQVESKPEGGGCASGRILLEEAGRVADGSSSGPTQDAAIMAALQRIEHFEIAGYRFVRALARHLRLDDAVEVIGTLLDEELDTSEILASLIERPLPLNDADLPLRRPWGYIK
jgi:ferritin-like metal-binding protein YciE